MPQTGTPIAIAVRSDPDPKPPDRRAPASTLFLGQHSCRDSRLPANTSSLRRRPPGLGALSLFEWPKAPPSPTGAQQSAGGVAGTVNSAAASAHISELRCRLARPAASDILPYPTAMAHARAPHTREFPCPVSPLAAGPGNASRPEDESWHSRFRPNSSSPFRAKNVRRPVADVPRRVPAQTPGS